MNLKFLFTILLIAATVFVTSCSKSDDADPDESDSTHTTTFIYDVPYTLQVTSGKSMSKMTYTESEDGSAVYLSFTEEDVAKPLVMTITGKDVSGTLTLQNTEGLFSGTLKAPSDAPDTLMLTATIEIPAAEGDGIDYSTISLADLMQKCGHKYSATFQYKHGEPIALIDSKAYFLFKMSCCQHWMEINNSVYILNDEGMVWLAVDGRTSVITNFYRQAYEKVDGGTLYTIDRSGYVDMGIRNILWADRNVGAENIWDYGDYYVWEDALKCVTMPMELPVGGPAYSEDNDYQTLWRNTDMFIDPYHGVEGLYVFRPGHTDTSNDPFLFLPLGGTMNGGARATEDYGCYWTCTEYNDDNAYRFFFRVGNKSPNSYCGKSSLGGLSVRPIRRGNNQDEEGIYHKEVKPLVAFFPIDYPTSDVKAWYSYKDEVKQEEWAFYLMNDNKYLVTQNIVDKDRRVLHLYDNFEYGSAKDDDFNNFKINIKAHIDTILVEIKDSVLTFDDKKFHRETEFTELVHTDATVNNADVNPLWFRWPQELHTLTAWYKQVDARYNDFMVLYLASDGDFYVLSCVIKDGGRKEVTIADGNFIVNEGSVLDYRNMSVTVYAHVNGIDYPAMPITFKDGRCTILNYTMELQDFSVLRKMLGF